MSELHNKNIINLAYNFTDKVQKNSYDFFYSGTISSSIVSHILSLAEEKLNSKAEYLKARKKVYFVAVEILQNITRHQILTGVRDFDVLGLFSMKKFGNTIYLTTGNLIDNRDIEIVTKKIEQVNSMSSDDLSLYYNKVLKTGQISEKGGAGLGLIAIAKKACGAFKYKFVGLNEHLSYFYFEVALVLERKDGLNDFEENTESLQQVIDIHQDLKMNNAVVNYSVNFNHTNFINLFSIVLNQLGGSYFFKKRVINTMIEMIQNVVYYSEDFDFERHEKPGVFFLAEHNEAYFLTSGNYLLNKKVTTLENKLQAINALERKYFDDVYKDLLFAHYTSESETLKPDLSFLEMRIRSKNKLVYSVHKVDEKFSFFVLQCIIRKRF